MANKKEEIDALSAALLAAINAPVPVNPTCRISKSKFMAGLQCPKREYLEVHHPELAVGVDDGRLEQGKQVGVVARGAFPGGVLVAADHKSLSEAIRDTRELLSNPEVPALFEATFARDGVLARVDVLRRNGAGFRLTEVKSTTTVKPEHTDEVSIQKYVVEGSGLRVGGTDLMHLSRDYVYDGTLESAVESPSGEKSKAGLPSISDWFLAQSNTNPDSGLVADRGCGGSSLPNRRHAGVISGGTKTESPLNRCSAVGRF